MCCFCMSNIVGAIVYVIYVFVFIIVFFFFQAEDGIRDLVRSRGLGDVYKRQIKHQVAQILKRLGAANRAEAISKALDLGIAVLPSGVGEIDTLSLIHI